jgi:hypothetical protein
MSAMLDLVRFIPARIVIPYALAVLMTLWQTSYGSCQVAADAPKSEATETSSPASAQQEPTNNAGENGEGRPTPAAGQLSTDTNASPNPAAGQPLTDAKAAPNPAAGQLSTDTKPVPNSVLNDQKPVLPNNDQPKASPSKSWIKIAVWTLVGIVSLGILIALLYSPMKRARRPSLPPSDPNAREGFSRHHSAFSDLYGEIWQAAEAIDISDDERRQILIRWQERLTRVGDHALLTAWTRLGESEGNRLADDVKRQAVAWLGSLESWGLIREWPPEIKIDKHTLTRFHILPRCEDGVAVVKSPCWIFNGRVLEKGFAIAQGVMPR